MRQLRRKLSQQEVQYKEQLRLMEDTHEQQLITIRSEAKEEVQYQYIETLLILEVVLEVQPSILLGYF